MPKSKSYRQATCCQANCHYLDVNENEVCWGQVDVIEEDNTEDDYWWVHSCEGHANCAHDGLYKLEN